MKTIIANEIIIQNPTDKVKKWCKNNLIYENPEYYRKKAMGFWLGNTPKNFRMFTVSSNVYRLPFGVLRRIWKLIKNDEYEVKFKVKKIYPRSLIKLYDYQEKAVEKMIKARNGVLISKAGSGKTVVFLELICRLSYKALWINNKKDLMQQALDRAKSNIVNCEFGTITEGKVNIGDITFSTIQTLSKIDLDALKDEFGIIVCDECFPKKTPILTKNGIKNIEDIKIGDKVLSYNHKLNMIEEKEVLTVFKKKPKEIMTINGKISCTSNHPIYTKRGYIEAKELNINDYVLSYLWKRSEEREYNQKSILLLSKNKKAVLFKRMFRKRKGYYKKKNVKYVETKMARKRFQREKYKQNERKQSNVQLKNCRKTKRYIKKNKTQTTYSRWEWERFNYSSKKINGIFERNKSNCRIYTANKMQKRRWVSNSLQNRYSNTSKNDSNRNRWSFSQQSGSKTSRYKKREIFDWIRVESIEIQEQTSDGTFGGVCEDGYVYNIEVKDNNNYFANDILVHNCQNFFGTPSKLTQTQKVLSRLSARYKYGCTACLHRSDKLEKTCLDLIGDVIYEVPESEIADKIIRASIQPVHTNFVPRECLGADGVVSSFSELINELCFDEERNNLIIEDIINNKDKHCIVLSDRLEQLRYLKDKLGFGLMIDGSMVSKKGKEQRREAIEKMRTGEEHVLFASYSLAKEGLDIPILDRLFFASPKRDKSVIIQSVGRIERIYEGKSNPIVYDYVDDCDINFSMLEKMFNGRKTIYRKNGNQIIQRGKDNE